MARYLPPPSGVAPPVLWGTEDRLRELFGDRASGLEVRRREFNFRFRSPAPWLEFFRTHFGPVKVALETLDEAGAAGLAADTKATVEQFNRAGDRALVAPGEYLEVVACV